MDKLLTGRRVLVVEDEMLVLIMIEDMLDMPTSAENVCCRGYFGSPVSGSSRPVLTPTRH